MSISGSSKATSRSHVYARDFDGDLVILDLAGGDYYALDEIGARLWAGLMAGHTVADIAQELTAEFEVDRATVEQDLLDLLHDLVTKGLVDVVGGA